MKKDDVTDAAPEPTFDELRAEIEALKAKNAALEGEFKRATDAARSNAVLLSQWQEVHAGKTEPDDEGVVQDLWEFTIDLALNGGNELKINGQAFYHGQTYIFTTDQLRMIKEMVYRTHTHEKNVMGHQNENFYRQQNSRSLTTGRVVNM